jgi:hypothetical protein
MFDSRSPKDRVPIWMQLWMRLSPLFFLVFSVLSFAIGFVFFAFSSQQVRSH